ncbi:helix-turn-helix domain-containing protein [Pseudofrankia saprophytica]|uniref:helix-turn-helix domain-containing protein n=1 Tax=Pseudofrankia saprophytica TaxID=298655 RepID=UPI001E412197|nr:helix-turn-helix domain-containing protein [Pseudofrankia saprophytica]
MAFDGPRDQHRDLSADPVESTGRVAQVAPPAGAVPAEPAEPEAPVRPTRPEVPAGSLAGSLLDRPNPGSPPDRQGPGSPPNGHGRPAGRSADGSAGTSAAEEVRPEEPVLAASEDAASEDEDVQSDEAAGVASPEAADDGATIGARLARARSATGMSIDEVSARTRIRATLIRQMEQDDFSGVGGSVYARGHIRGIARTLGIDPEPLVAAYDADHERIPSPSSPSSASSFDPLRHGEGRRGGRHWGTAMVVSAAVLCLLALVAFLIPGSSRHDGPTPTAVTGAPSPSAAASPGAAPGAAPPSTAPPTEVNLRLEAVSAQSWLEVSDDSNHVVLRQILAKGDTRTLTAKALRVKMGNAGAMDLSCNGHKLGTMGAPGQVVTVLVALGGSGDCTVDGAAPAAGRSN